MTQDTPRKNSGIFLAIFPPFPGRLWIGVHPQDPFRLTGCVLEGRYFPFIRRVFGEPRCIAFNHARHAQRFAFELEETPSRDERKSSATFAAICCRPSAEEPNAQRNRYPSVNGTAWRQLPRCCPSRHFLWRVWRPNKRSRLLPSPLSGAQAA